MKSTGKKPKIKNMFCLKDQTSHCHGASSKRKVFLLVKLRRYMKILRNFLKSISSSIQEVSFITFNSKTLRKKYMTLKKKQSKDLE